MPARESDTQIGATSQLSENRGGLKSFSDPSSIAKGGSSTLDDADFGTSSAFRRRDASRNEINRQIHLNRKMERAVRVGYRAALRRGDGKTAMALLNEAEKSGNNPFGIRQAGDDARQAFREIASKRSLQIRGGQMQFDPSRDVFQRTLTSRDIDPRANAMGQGNQQPQPQQPASTQPLYGTGPGAKSSNKFFDDLSKYVLSGEQNKDIQKYQDLYTPTEYTPLSERFRMAHEKVNEMIGNTVKAATAGVSAAIPSIQSRLSSVLPALKDRAKTGLDRFLTNTIK